MKSPQSLETFCPKVKLYETSVDETLARDRPFVRGHLFNEHASTAEDGSAVDQFRRHQIGARRLQREDRHRHHQKPPNAV
jgi:hypothetical protein